MNKLLLLSAAFLTLSFTTTESTLQTKHIHGEAIVPQNDKVFLRDYYRETKNQLKKSIKGLSTAQLQYKPSASEWSVSQCLEHIIKTEKAIFGMTKEALEKPANPERKDEVKVTDQQLIDGMTDRSEKAEAPAMLTGTGSYQDVATALKDFQAQRTEILDYIETVPLDELRNHINDSPFGPVDSYHSILFIAAHTARHTLQIEEVKSKDTFPKE
ncbi:DinB family protein [Parapedobacter pyrenivorans]|uniref:DinB family protein n=1 Tax=Parapedobacter pyrenivorans TaxID=1305674 RepID=UPI00333EF0CA